MGVGGAVSAIEIERDGSIIAPVILTILMVLLSEGWFSLPMENSQGPDKINYSGKINTLGTHTKVSSWWDWFEINSAVLKKVIE